MYHTNIIMVKGQSFFSKTGQGKDVCSHHLNLVTQARKGVKGFWTGKEEGR